MNVGSLFAGIGGFDLGLERAGMRTVWQVEREPFRRAVLARHFPDAKRYEDVRDVGAHNLEWVDVICGGFPCQDLSLAGKGAGIDGARSGLWAEYARIVGELRPRYVIVENVPALLGRGMGRVLGDLAALGYDAEWDCLPASAFGAPHRRDRLWIVAYPGEHGFSDGERGQDRHEGAPLSLNGDAGEQRGDQRGDSGRGGGEAQRPSSGAWDSEVQVAHAAGNGRRQGRARRSAGASANGQDVAAPGVADAPRAGFLRAHELENDREGERGGRGRDAASPSSLRGIAGRESTPWTTEPDVGRVASGIPDRVDRLAALGDALVPQIAAWIGTRILSYEQAVNDSQKAAA